ncbi:cupin domain-containing protein [Thauera sp. 63]|uniref:cupin domain-containing protein n=1 Tax=Thauera sp. 63 TaxID=497321 RepID=UPI00031B61DB|nr:cupin domain-containing protein [Thauera sp. 63]
MSEASRLRRGNLYVPLPEAGVEEHFQTLFAGTACRVERIVSHRHASPPGFWYEQAEDEWVVLLQGAAELGFDDGGRIALTPGDWVEIPAGCRHRVLSTALATVWLAVHGSRSGAAPG